MKKKILIILSLLLVLSVLGYVSFEAYRYYSGIYAAAKRDRAIRESRKAGWVILTKQIQSAVTDFNGQSGVCIEDLRTGFKFCLNGVKPFPSASMVKVPVMVVCYDAYSRGMLDLNEGLVLKNKFKVSGSGSLKRMPSGTKIDVEQLIELMITESDNTAANMLIELFGFDYLNQAFKNRLGLNGTDILRKMMDFRSRKNGVENFTTVDDMALLFKGMYRGSLLSRRISAQSLETLKKQKMRDRIPRCLPADTVVAHKTGLENGICHDAGIVFTPRGDYLICVLTRHANKTARPAKKLIADISRLVYNYMLQ